MISIKEIQKSLGDFYQGKIDGDWGPLTQAAMDISATRNGTSVPPWLTVAERELGVSEISGTRANPRIVEYHSYTDLKATSDEVAWCSAFANFCVQKAGLRGTRSAAARSWLGNGSKLLLPKYGCVAVLWRSSPTSWEGHVGFVVASDHDSIALLAGNQSNRVKVEVFPRSKVLDFRSPS